MTLRPLVLSIALLSALAGCATAPSAAAAPSVSAAAVPAKDKAQRLEALYAQYWEETLQLNPVQATFQGDPRYNHLLPDFLSADFRRQLHDFNQRWLKTVRDIGPEGLAGQALLSYEIFVRSIEQELESEQFPDWMLPIDQFNNIAGFAAQLGSGTSAQPFQTVKDYEDWLARGARIPGIFDTAIANMREGMKAGVVQPRALMVKVIPQFDALIKDKPEDTLFWGPVTNMPKEFSAADKARLTAAYRELIGQQLIRGRRVILRSLCVFFPEGIRPQLGLEVIDAGHGFRFLEPRTKLIRAGQGIFIVKGFDLAKLLLKGIPVLQLSVNAEQFQSQIGTAGLP